MSVTRSMDGKCSQCGYSGGHDIVAMHANGIGFCFGMECPACGKLVPEQAWQKYQRTGDVVIPNMLRNPRIFPKDQNQGFGKATRRMV